MQAVVLAGGFGTRLRQVVPDLPKPMAPVAGRPFLEILLTVLARKGFQTAVLSLGHMAEKIRDHFGSSFAGLSLQYVVETVPLGTGGAIRLASTKCAFPHYFVFNGDSYLDLEVAEVNAQWQQSQVPIIVARRVPDTERYGRLREEDGRVAEFVPKGVSGPGLINGGCYVFAANELDACPLGQPFSIEADYFPKQVLSRRFDIFVSNGQFIDIGIPTDYARAQLELKGVCE